MPPSLRNFKIKWESRSYSWEWEKCDVSLELRDNWLVLKNSKRQIVFALPRDKVISIKEN